MSTIAPSSTSLAGLWRRMGEVRKRFGLRFSGTGRTAGAFAITRDGSPCVEVWHLEDDEPRCQTVDWSPVDPRVAEAAGVPVEVRPLDEGYVLALRRQGGGLSVIGLATDGRTAQPEPIGVIDHPLAALFPAPDGSRRALVLSRDADGESAVWSVSAEPGGLRLITRAKGLLVSGGAIPAGGWTGAESFACTQLVEGRARGMRIDTRSGQLEALGHIAAGSSDHVLLTAPGAGRILLASDARGSHSLVEMAADGGSPDFLDAAESIAGTVTPLCYDPAGARLLVHAAEGLRTRLLVVQPDREEPQPLPVPDGSVTGPASWLRGPDSDRVHCILAGPATPFALLRLDPGAPGRWERFGDGTPASRPGRWVDGWREEFPGPAGPIEAVVVGRESWRHAEQVVVALHGGPERAWSLEFDPLFQYLAHAGITVIAPNQRGSVGYGQGHQHAIRGRWGGPDLEDVRHLARHVRRHRTGGPDGPLLLLGRSYGAFLSLLAACCEPDAWSRVAVIAPFLSGHRLYPEAAEPVRAMMDRLGARSEIDDDVGPRDVVRLLPGLRAGLMILHGTDDELVPVTQSRALREHLAQAGRVEGDDFAYIEVPGAGHGAIDGS